MGIVRLGVLLQGGDLEAERCSGNLFRDGVVFSSLQSVAQLQLSCSCDLAVLVM
jgi:hypothetical protein